MTTSITSTQLLLLFLAINVKLSTCQQKPCDAIGIADSCWAKTVQSKHWRCSPRDTLTTCLQQDSSTSGGMCNPDEEFVKRKAIIVEGASVFDRWLCRNDVTDELFRNSICDNELGLLGKDVFSGNLGDIVDCTYRHFKLEEKIRRLSQSDCVNNIIRPMLHEAMQRVECRDIADESWTELNTLSSANYTICNSSFGAAIKCKESLELNVENMCNNSPLSSCVKKEFENVAKSCSVERVKTWTESAMRQYQIREQLVCSRPAFYDGLKKSEADCHMKFMKVYFWEPFATNKATCQYIREQLSNMKGENDNCIIMLTQYRKDFIEKACADPGSTEGPSEGTKAPSEGTKAPSQSQGSSMAAILSPISIGTVLIVLSSIARNVF